jgi:MarR family transcriptional regulator for hemolysin
LPPPSTRPETVKICQVSDPQERFAKALHGASRAWRQAIDRRLRHLGLSQAGWMTIAIAAKSDPAPSQSELAEKLGVEGATMVAMVDRLVKAGLARREASTTDRRVKRVKLTTAGTELYGNLKAEADQLLEQLLKDSDANRLLDATDFLEQLQRRIEAL